MTDNNPTTPKGEAAAHAGYGVGQNEDPGTAAGIQLWEGDHGTLPWQARRALVTLVRGPYLDGLRHKDQWKALLGAHDAIQARLADLFLDLVVDTDRTLAFVRNIPVDEAPTVVRTRPLTFTDTVILLHVRQLLLQARLRGETVFVSRSDLADAVAVYRPHASTDEAGFTKAVKASLNKLVDAEILQKTDIEDRFRISPILELIFGAEEITAVTAQYEAMLHSSVGGSAPDDADDQQEEE